MHRRGIGRVGSAASMVESCLAELPDDRGEVVAAVRALAARKSHYAPYLMNACFDSGRGHDLRSAYAAAGRKFDMGKGRLRFRKLDELRRFAVAGVIASSPVEASAARHEASHVRN